jgi:hypothetical protein
LVEVAQHLFACAVQDVHVGAGSQETCAERELAYVLPPESPPDVTAWLVGRQYAVDEAAVREELLSGWRRRSPDSWPLGGATLNEVGCGTLPGGVQQPVQQRGAHDHGSRRMTVDAAPL